MEWKWGLCWEGAVPGQELATVANGSSKWNGSGAYAGREQCLDKSWQQSFTGKISAAFADGVVNVRAIIDGRQREQGDQWRQ